MLKIKLNNNESLVLPTGISEINFDFLKQCIDGYHIADDYSLVGLVYKDSLTALTSISNANKELRLSVIPIFIAAGNTDDNYIKSIKMRDIITISGADLSLGNHIYFNDNELSIGRVKSIISKNRVSLIAKVEGQVPVCLLEFKLVPNNTIHGNWDNQGCQDIRKKRIYFMDTNLDASN